MADVQPGRWTHEIPEDGELTVFLIGMRVNRWWRPDVWMPVAAAMRPMLVELSRDPDSGLLGFRALLGASGVTVVQYWASPEKLYAYAADPAKAHRPAWAAYYRRIRRSSGVVGIWHETFPARAAESIYNDMPPTGLGAAVGLRPVTQRNARARERLAAA